ncbi:Mis12-Mtw1 protein family-domain-containing protein, partial [Hygrophoropsis aurantiaca]
MNGTTIHPGGNLENPMASLNPPSTSKRKADDSNPLIHAAKRSKKEGKAAAPKRKLIGEEQPGGLVIIRAPRSRPTSPQPQPSSQPAISTTTRAPSRPPQSSSQPIPGPSKPPSKKFKADGSSRAIAKLRDGTPAAPRDDPELDEDIRQMDSETDNLRQRSRAKDAVNPEFQFPPPPAQRRPPDALQPLLDTESPQIQRNKLMREGLPLPRARTPQPQPQILQHQHQHQHSRRSSMSMRGKRISTSFENTGVISQPHTSVRNSSFYKHIDCELPEPQRARQLLIWSAARAMARETSPSRSEPGRADGKDPPVPELTERERQIVRTVQEDFIRLLAEKKIDTSVYNHDDASSAGKILKPNEQNVKNRAREIKFREHIERAKAESDAWTQVDQYYNAYIANSKADLERRRQGLLPPSERAQGKQRATSQEPKPDDWTWLLPRPSDLSEHFRAAVDLDLIKRVMAADDAALDERMKDVEFKVDSVFSFVNSAVQTTGVAEAELDHRFALLSRALDARTQTRSAPRSPTSLAAHLQRPARGASQPPLLNDPQELFRALSRVDRERPPGQVGDAARRAVREVQRVQEGGGGIGERRLTELGGATPRKAPGTPRRKDR